MKRPSLARVALAAASAAVVATVTGFAATSAGASAAWPPGHGLPPRVFAPYFETYNTSGDLAALSQQSGARYLSLAFLETDQPGSCTAYWNGATSTPVASSSFGSDIAAIQARGGNVIPSFGGFTADTTNTDIADSCTSVSAIAQVYENVITTYHVPRIDLDVEADSLNNTAGINRRNEAIAQVEAWAAAHGRRIQFSYTLPSLTTGLDAQDEAVLQNAIADGARISVVNLLTFDYFIGTAQEMATDTDHRRRRPAQPARGALPAGQPGPPVADGRRHGDARHRRLRPGRDLHPGGRGHHHPLGAAHRDRHPVVLGPAAR